MNGGTFILTSGHIQNNTGINGGGVYLDGGEFTMNGGVIMSNSGKEGGGVYVNSRTFTMTDGAVLRNEGEDVGGVYVNGGLFTMNGGAVTSNTGSSAGGVYVNKDGKFELSGKPVITANKAGDEASNVCLDTGKQITIVGKLENSAPIGITLQQPDVFMRGLKGNGDSRKFQSDKEGYAVGIADDGNAFLAEADFVVTFNSNGGSPVSTQYIMRGCKVVKPNDPIKEGYDFVDWYVLGTSNKFDFENMQLESDIWLIARWVAAYYTVTFEVNGGEGEIEQQIVEHGKTAQEPDDPPRRGGYAFAGWLLGGEEFDFGSPVKSNLTLTAKWVDRVRSLTLEPGQCVTLAGEGTRIESDAEATVKADGMKVTAAEGVGGTANLTVFDGDKEIMHYSVTVSAISTGVFTLPGAVTEVKANAFAGLPMAKKVILGENVTTLDKYAFAGTNFSQLVVNSKTLKLPEGFAFNKEAGMTILCPEDSEIAKQLTGEAFEDVNISVVYPAE